VSFTFTSVIDTKEVGVGMTIAVLVDATIIRSLLVPATMRLEEIAFEFFKGHGSRRGRFFGIVNAVTGVGESPLKALGHPAKQRFDSPLY